MLLHFVLLHFCIALSRLGVRVNLLFRYLVNVTLWLKILAINVGFSRPYDPMPLKFLPCSAAFLLGN